MKLKLYWLTYLLIVFSVQYSFAVHRFQSPTTFFIENKGQVGDQYNNPRTDVLISGVANGMNFHIRNNGISYQLSHVETWKDDTKEQPVQDEASHKIPNEYGIYRVDINWLKSNKKIKVIKQGELQGYTHFYNVPEGVEPALFVKNYESVILKNVWEGVDIYYYFSEGNLEYDFIVHNPDDYKKIAFTINGADLSISPSGELIMKTPLGEIREGRLKVLQNNKEIGAKWQLKDNVIRFDVPAYNPKSKLTIDPVVRVWGTYVGSSFYDNTNFDEGYSCTTSASGDVFIAGTIQNGSTSANIITTGAHLTTFQGVIKAFLVKFDQNGVRQWGTYYGGANSDDFGFSCAVDASGNVFLVGRTSATSNIATPGAFQTTKNVSSDAYLVKFNSAGVRQWGTYFGKEYGEEAKSVTVDMNGDIYFSGTAGPTTNFGTPGTHQQTGAGGTDAFLTKFNTSGARLWTTLFGGEVQEQGTGCITDAQGNVYLTGHTRSTSGIASSGASQLVFGGNRDVFIAKFNGSGVRQWSTYIGGSGDDYVYEGDSKPATDAAGNVYVCGSAAAASTSGIATPGAHQTTGGGVTDAFLVKFNASGVRQWGTYYGGSSLDMGFCTATDASGNVYISGQTASSAGISTVGVHQPNIATGYGDAFLATFDPNGVRQWGTYYGGPGIGNGEDRAYHVTVHQSSGSIYMSGHTNSTTGIATAGSHQPTFAGAYYDAFLVKFIDCPTAGTLSPTANSPICAGQTLNLSAPTTAGATYSWTGPNGFTSSQQNPSITNVTTVAAGTYDVVVTANGCPGATGSVVVSVSPPITVTASVANASVCAGQTISLLSTAPSGATYQWAGPNGYTSTQQNPVITNAASAMGGTYTVTATDNGCTATANVNVLVNALQTLTASSNSPVCIGNTIQLNINPLQVQNYSWLGPNGYTSSQPNPSITNAVAAMAGTYTVTVLDYNGCTARDSIAVSVINPPTLTASSNSPVCAGHTLNLQVNTIPSATYSWTGPNGFTSTQQNPSFIPVATNASGNYDVTVSVGGCSVTTSTVVTVNPSPVVNASVNSPVCVGADLNLSVNTVVNASYAWSGVNAYTSTQQNPVINAVSANAAGMYVVTITDNANGCSTADTVNVTVNNLPVVTASYNSPLCEGSTLNLSVNTTTGGTYTWSTSGGYTSTQQSPVIANVQLSQAGTYLVVVTNAEGCSDTGSVNVVVNAAVSLTVTTTSSPATICEGETSALMATGADTYVWSNNLGNGTTHNVTPTATTTYTVTGTDAATGCTATSSVSVNVNPLPTVAVTTSQSTLCLSGTAVLTAIGANTYQWSTGDATDIITVSPAGTTTYTVTGTSAAGCSDTATQTVTVMDYAAPVFPFANTVTLCYGADIPVLITNSQNGISGTWQPSTISNTQSGTYTFTPASGQCANNYVLNVTVLSPIVVTAGPDTAVDLASSVHLFTSIAGSSSGTFVWTPTENLSCTNCSNPVWFAQHTTAFNVTYTDTQTGCKASDSVTINVNYDPYTIRFIPNAFTPNDDGNNDFFQIYGDKIKEVDIQIFDKWGQLLFDEKSPNPQWNGYYKGRLLPQDIYTYRAIILFYNKNKVENKGIVTLLR